MLILLTQICHRYVFFLHPNRTIFGSSFIWCTYMYFLYNKSKKRCQKASRHSQYQKWCETVSTSLWKKCSRCFRPISSWILEHYSCKNIVCISELGPLLLSLSKVELFFHSTSASIYTSHLCLNIERVSKLLKTGQIWAFGLLYCSLNVEKG